MTPNKNQNMNLRSSVRTKLTIFALLAFAPGCASVQPMVVRGVPHQESGQVRLTLDDRREVLIKQVVITRDSIFGQTLSPGSQPTVVRFARSEVRTMQGYKPDAKKTALIVAGIVLAAWAGYMYWSLTNLDM